MIPGPALYYSCPNCHKTKAMRSLASSNTLGGELWSDGQEFYLMCPRLSPIQKCLHCGNYSLLEQWKYTGKTNDKEYGTTGRLSYAEAKEAYIQLSSSSLMTKAAYQIALFFIHAFNDEFRRPKLRKAIYEERLSEEIYKRFLPQFLLRSHPCPTDDDNNLFFEATQYAIDLSNTTQDAQILKAELHRERGEWVEAYEILHSMNTGKKQWIVDTILYYACKRDASLIPFVIAGKEINYSNRANFHTISIPENPEVLDERQRNIDDYINGLSTERVKDIITDSLGGIYDKSTGTLLKIVSPSFKKYEVKDGTSHIGDYAVFNNKRINRIKLPSDVKTIGVKAFYGCENLSMILASNHNIQVIEDRAFMNCKSLTRIQFIENLKYLGRSVFAGMEKLESIILPENIDSIPEFTFFECESLQNICIPSSVRRIESFSFQHTAIVELEMPDSIETLGDAVFSQCFNLESVKLSSKLTIIPERTFDSCKELHFIEIPKGVKVIKKGAFENTPALKCLRFYGKVKTISKSAFKDSGLEKIIVPFWTKSHYQRLFPNVKIEIKFF